MRKKGYKGVKCTKRNLPTCDGVCRTYDALQFQYATLLSQCEDIESFKVNVLMDGLSMGEYTSDFVIIKKDGGLMVRECVYRERLLKPLTCKMLDASRQYWLSHGVHDWGIVIDMEKKG